MQGSFFGTGRVDDKLVETDMLEFNASWVYLWENTFQEKIKFFSGVVSSWTFFPPSWNFSAWLWWLVGKMSHGEVRPPHSHAGEEEELKCVLSLTVSPEKISACRVESVGRQNETEPSPSRVSAYLWQDFAYVTSSLRSELTTYHCNGNNTPPNTAHAGTQGDLTYQVLLMQSPSPMLEAVYWRYFNLLLFWSLYFCFGSCKSWKFKWETRIKITEAVVQTSNTSGEYFLTFPPEQKVIWGISDYQLDHLKGSH